MILAFPINRIDLGRGINKLLPKMLMFVFPSLERHGVAWSESNCLELCDECLCLRQSNGGIFPLVSV